MDTLSFEPVLSSPCGDRNPDGSWRLPEHTLGWDVLEWQTQYIRQPDGPNAGDRFTLTPEQVRFVLWWYAVDANGRWLFTRGVLRRSKGWGKSPFVAALAITELCGPCRFAGWAEGGEWPDWRDRPYEPGEPIAEPVNAAWVQLAGVSEKQTTNTLSMVLAMVAESPAVDDYGLDLGLTRIYSAGGGRLEPITASAATAEGARPTFIVEDETHLWTDSNGGADLDRVNRRNVGKIPGGTARVLETTNAHAAGEQSVAERSFEAWRLMVEGKSRGSALLYDCREAPPEIDLADEAELLAGLACAYGDSVWVDLERIRDEVWDPGTPVEDSRRFYMNQIAASHDAWIAEHEWRRCLDASKVVADRSMITLGFDGSRKRAKGVTDATALIGCRLSDGHLFEIGVWEHPPGPAGNDWEVPVTEVDAAVHHAFNRYQVVGFYADPARWEGFVAQWEAQYARRLKVKASPSHPMEWWMTGGRITQVVRALDKFHGAVIDAELTHSGEYALTRHVLNCRRRVTRVGLTVAKEHPDSAKKIDAAVAAVLAYQARLDAIAAGVLARRAGFVPRRIN
jgi:hypothetical protein